MAVIEARLKQKRKKKERYLCELSNSELRKAIVKMLKGLNLKAGSIIGWYDVYEAIFRERNKARENCKIGHKHP